MADQPPDRDRPALLMPTLKAAAAVAVLSVLAAHWLADGLDQRRLSRLAADASRGDPVTTGSITRAAGATKLDPCAVDNRRR